MHAMMGGGTGEMMQEMGALWLLLAIVLVLAIAALLKYLLSGG